MGRVYHDPEVARREKQKLIRERDRQIAGEQEDHDAELVAIRDALVKSDLKFNEALAARIVRLLDEKTLDWAYCPDCRRKVHVDKPASSARLKALELIANYLVGKPKERQELEITLQQKPLQEMTLAEKQQYLLELKRRELGAGGDAS